MPCWTHCRCSINVDSIFHPYALQDKTRKKKRVSWFLHLEIRRVDKT